MKMLLIDGFVTNLSAAPDEEYTADIVGRFVDVPSDAPADLRVGYVYRDAKWIAPGAPVSAEAQPAGATYRTTMTPVRFKAQFPLQAQIAIQLARNYVPADPANPDTGKATTKAALDILFGLLADLNQAGSDIDVAEPSVQAALDYLASASFITTDLATQIKRGIEVTAV